MTASQSDKSQTCQEQRVGLRLWNRCQRRGYVVCIVAVEFRGAVQNILASRDRQRDERRIHGEVQRGAERFPSGGIAVGEKRVRGQCQWTTGKAGVRKGGEGAVVRPEGDIELGIRVAVAGNAIEKRSRRQGGPRRDRGGIRGEIDELRHVGPEAGPGQRARRAVESEHSAAGEWRDPVLCGYDRCQILAPVPGGRGYPRDGLGSFEIAVSHQRERRRGQGQGSDGRDGSDKRFHDFNLRSQWSGFCMQEAGRCY